MKLITTALLPLILCLAASAQSSYTVSKVTALSGAAEVITVQGSTAAGVRLPKVIAFKAFDASCSAACTITLERDGAAATTTPLTPTQLNSLSGPASALAFSSSNVGAGTVLAQYSLTAGGQIAISLAGKQLYSGFENLTIRTSALSGTVTLNAQWEEK